MDEQLESLVSLVQQLHDSLENEESSNEFVEQVKSSDNSVRHQNSLVVPLCSSEEDIRNLVKCEDSPASPMG